MHIILPYFLPKFLRSFLTLGFIALVFAVAQAEGGQIQGKVKEEGGKSLVGVTVKASRAITRSLDNQDTNQKDYETKTDDKGDFVLSGLLPGNYALTFELTGYRTFVTRRFELAAGETFKVPKVIELSREPEAHSLIRGAVLDASGYSLENASVSVERADGKKFKKIEKASVTGGQFAFRVPSETGTYRLSASADGFATAVQVVTIEKNEIRSIVIQLEKKK
jgi:Carboxypeptidase regulatory-like domain